MISYTIFIISIVSVFVGGYNINPLREGFMIMAEEAAFEISYAVPSLTPYFDNVISSYLHVSLFVCGAIFTVLTLFRIFGSLIRRKKLTTIYFAVVELISIGAVVYSLFF